MGSAFRIADRMVLLHQGQMVAEVPRRIPEPSDPRIRQFVEGGAEGPWRSRHHESPRHQYRSHCHRQPHHHRDVDRLGRWSGTLIGGRAYEVFFPVAADLGGIGEGDPVRLGGHTISKVESVDVEIPLTIRTSQWWWWDSVCPTPFHCGMAQVEVQTSFTGVAG